MSPGLKYRHYVPEVPMTLFTGEPEAVRKAIGEAVQKAEAEGKRAGVIDFGGDAEKAARLFFKELRKYKAGSADMIFAAGIREEGAGIAVMNRMRSAADGKVVSVSKTEV